MSDTNQNGKQQDPAHQRAMQFQALRDHVVQLKLEEELLVEVARHHAVLLAARFNSLVENGLTRDEALFVIIKRGIQ